MHGFRPLPKHSGAPFHPLLSALDFGTCSGLHLPIDGQVLNRQDGLQLRTLTPPFIAFSNDEIDPKLHDERQRWPVDGPSWMLPMSFDSAYAYATKRHPSLGVPRRVLHDLFNEDSELLRRERRNYSHGNAMRFVTVMMVTELGMMEEALYVLHPVGAFLNVLQLSRVADQDSSSATASEPSPQRSRFIAKSVIDVSSTIVDISAPNSNFKRCDRLIVVTTTSQFIFFVRLRTESCRDPQVELLHKINLSAQPFPSISNPLITHECSLVTDDGRITIYDASTLSQSYACAVDSSEATWLRQSYTCHPRVLHIASRRKLRRLDLRCNRFNDNVAGNPAYNHDPPFVITAFNSDLRDPFSFAVCNWDNISLFDERYAARPVLRWQHHRQKRPITHIEISTYDIKENYKALTAFGHDFGHADIYRYSKQDDGLSCSLSSSQQIDPITHVKLRGIAFSHLSSLDCWRCYRLTELGTVFCSEYSLVDDEVDHGEPCPALAVEDPLALVSKSNLTPYQFMDFTKPIQDIIDRNSSDKTPMLKEDECFDFMLQRQERISEFVSQWRSFSELYCYLRSDLDMRAVSSSLDFRIAVNRFSDQCRMTTRLLPGLSDEEAKSTVMPRVVPPHFQALCTCSLDSASECRSSEDCARPDCCQILHRIAICAQGHVISVDFDDVWAKAKADYHRSGKAAKRTVDLSTDVDALMSLLNAPDNEEHTVEEPRAPVDVDDELSVVETFELLRQAWDDLIQSDMAHEDI